MYDDRIFVKVLQDDRFREVEQRRLVRDADRARRGGVSAARPAARLIRLLTHRAAEQNTPEGHPTHRAA